MEEVIVNSIPQMGVTGVFIAALVYWVNKIYGDLNKRYDALQTQYNDAVGRLQNTEEFIRNDLMDLLNKNHKVMTAIVEAMNKRPCLSGAVVDVGTMGGGK